jgi:polysaccharide chain length determinant protein (PEP-CTERM system associated)
MVQRELTPADYWGMIRRQWVPIVILTIIGAPIAYGVSRFLPSRYKSQTLVLVEQPMVPTKLVEPVVATDLSERLATMQEQILSRTRLEPVIKQFGLYPGEVDRVPMEELVGRLRKAIDVTPVEPMAETRTQQLPGFYIAVTLDNPRTAQSVCTALTSMFISENLRSRQQLSEDTTQFLEQQLLEAKQKLDEQDALLADFKRRYIGSLPDEEQVNLNVLTGLTSQLDAATQALARAQQDKAFTQSVLAGQIAAWDGHSPETMQQQLVTLENQLANLKTRYTDDHPDVIKAKSDIAAVEKQIAEADSHTGAAGPKDLNAAAGEPNQITQLRGQIHMQEQLIAEKTKEQETIKRQIHLYQGRVQSSPAVEQQYKELTRGYQAALESYNELQKKRDQSAMATDLERRQEGEQFRVLDPANLPNKPSFPDPIRFSLGGMGIGLACGLALGFWREMRDTSMRSERDVESVLSLPVLAMIPEVAKLCPPQRTLVDRIADKTRVKRAAARMGA